MSVAEPQPAVPKPKLRWYHPTPGGCLAALLAVEGLLWLSDRFGWPTWHKGYAVLTAVAMVSAAMVLMLVWFAASLLFRQWFQFSIRSLMALTIAVAIPCSWFAVTVRQIRREREALVEIKRLDGSAWIEPSGPTWLRTLLGDDFLGHVELVLLHGPQVTDADLEHLKGMNQLHSLSIYGTAITDAGLENLEGLNQLQELVFVGTQVTDEGVRKLQQALPKCKIYK